MIVSSATNMLMMLIDRAFLSWLGREHMAAASSGGLMAFMTITFFFGIITYVNALVAQHLGAGQNEKCSVAATQGLLVGMCGYPVVLCMVPLGLFLFTVAGHDPAQQLLERQYYTIIVFGSIVIFAGLPIRSFFSGVGRTTVVMVSSAVAMLVNVAANYVLIFGKFGFPRMEMAGAAYGTIIGNLAGLLVLAAVYLRPRYTREFGVFRSFIFDWRELRTLLKFGTPSGTEFFLNIAAFNIFVQMFHSYGRDAAAGMTITFNWDMVAFIPMIGLHIATTSLVGRYMGAENPAAAERSAYSGIKLAAGYAGALGVLFVVCPGVLVRVFTPAGSGHDYSVVAQLAKPMLRLAALYTLADAVGLVFGGALRGAGDTRWCMRVSVALHWTMALCTFVMIRLLDCRPLLVWFVFVLAVVAMGGSYWLRFRGGSWKSLRVLAPPVEPAGVEAAALPHPEQVHE